MGVSARRLGALHKSDRADRASKRLRREPTLGEQRLWKGLRKLEGAHFRRQVPLGPYVVDFACHASRIVVEVDGDIHKLPDVAERDVERETWLKGRGYEVIRFSNEESIFNTGSVLQRLAERLGANTPTPNPSPQGGGGL